MWFLAYVVESAIVVMRRYWLAVYQYTLNNVAGIVLSVASGTYLYHACIQGKERYHHVDMKNRYYRPHTTNCFRVRVNILISNALKAGCRCAEAWCCTNKSCNRILSRLDKR